MAANNHGRYIRHGIEATSYAVIDCFLKDMAGGNSLYWKYDFTANNVTGYNVEIHIDLASTTENVTHGGIGVPHAQMCNIVTPQGNNPMNDATEVEAVTPPQPPPLMPTVQSEVMQIIVTKLLTPRLLVWVENMINSKTHSPRTQAAWS